MKARIATTIGAALTIIALSGCSSQTDISENAAKLQFPETWVKIGEKEGVTTDLERTYLTPPSNTDDELLKTLLDAEVIKERPVDDPRKGELHLRTYITYESLLPTRNRAPVELTVGPTLTVNEAAAKDSYKRDKKTISTKADDICAITAKGQELCDTEGPDATQVITIAIDI